MNKKLFGVLNNFQEYKGILRLEFKNCNKGNCYFPGIGNCLDPKEMEGESPS